MFLLLIVALLTLTAGIIWALHRNQLRRQVEVVDRIKDLDPLESMVLPDFAPAQTANTSAERFAAEALATDVASPIEPAAVSVAPATTATAPTQNGTEAVAWQDRVKQLKDQGELEQAVQLCQQNFPKAQAFQQAAVVLRLQIRQQLDHGQDAQNLADKLYRCAIFADLFRSGVHLKPLNPRRAMQALGSSEFPYAQIGHQQLKLLTKSDVKLLEQLWGKAERHAHAENVLGAQWEDLCRN